MPKTRDEQTHRRKQILNVLNDQHLRIESLDDLLAQLELRGIDASKSSVKRILDPDMYRGGKGPFSS